MTTQAETRTRESAKTASTTASTTVLAVPESCGESETEDPLQSPWATTATATATASTPSPFTETNATTATTTSTSTAAVTAKTTNDNVGANDNDNEEDLFLRFVQTVDNLLGIGQLQENSHQVWKQEDRQRKHLRGIDGIPFHPNRGDPGIELQEMP